MRVRSRRAASVAVQVSALLAAGVLLAGCGSSPVSHSPAALRSTTSVSLGPCTTAVAPEPKLSRPRIATTAVAGSPFGVAVSRDGQYSFVSGFGGGGSSRGGAYVEVLSERGFAPKLVRTISLGVPVAAGDSVTADGRYLLVASGSGAAVLSVARAETGRGHALVGFLNSPEPRGAAIPSTAGQAPGSAILPGALGSAIEVTSSANGRYAFVSLEYQDEIAVFDLRAALASGLRHSGFVGAIKLGQAVVGMAISPDGRWLYATSELAAGARPKPGANGLPGAYGTLSVINLHRAVSTPSRSVIATVPAGCGPVRVVVSPGSGVVWVTARESDALLAFSATKLVADPRHALLENVRVGEAPVGLIVIDHGARIVVADSNRFNAAGRSSGLTVVDTAAALAGKASLLGIIRAGGFPREFALEPNGHTLLVTNFESGQLETIDLDHLN